MTRTPSDPSPTPLLGLLEVPMVRAMLHRAQKQGIAWAKRLKRKEPHAALDTLVNLTIRRSLWRSGASGAIAGCGGVLSMATGSGDLLYFLYSELELAAAIFALHEIHLDEEQHRPILIGALLGLGANELIRLLGIHASKQPLHRLLHGLARPIVHELQQKLSQRLSTRLLERVTPTSLRWIPVGGALIGAGINVLCMQAAGEAIRLTAREYRDAINHHLTVETVVITGLDQADG